MDARIRASICTYLRNERAPRSFSEIMSALPEGTWDSQLSHALKRLVKLGRIRTVEHKWEWVW